MRFSQLYRFAFAALLAAGGLAAAALPAHALPSYARQTGFSCAACHTIYPELTPLGRRFKLTGYVLTTTPIQGTTEEQYVLNRTPPISAMAMISATETQKDPPDSGAGTTANPNAKAQNNTVSFPQQISFFYAGRITPNTGTFLQITYSGAANGFAMDNTDIRMVEQGAQFVYGLTLNNNPTVQDLWNSTPAFGFRYASSAIAPGPSAGIQLDSKLAQSVAGLGGYAAWLMGSSFVYGELSFYRSAHLGAPQPLDSTGSPVIQDTAPYLRLAYEVNWATSSLEVGALGFNADLLPTGQGTGSTTACVTSSAPTAVCNKGLNQVKPDKYTDSGIDGQFQYIPSDQNILTANAIWLHEEQAWGADTITSTNTANVVAGNNFTIKHYDHLDTQRVTGSYYHNRREGIVLQWFSTTGSKDAGLYSGNRTFRPDSDGYVAELVYNPYLNTRYSLQYTAYNTFNGAAKNYDNSGAKAADNNTLYLLAWLMF